MAATKVTTGPDPKLEKIFMARDLTRRTGALVEFQVQNLKMWPLVYTNITQLECQFSFENKTVTYLVKEMDGKIPKDWEERCKHLEKSVQMLLGDEYSVKILEGGKCLYPISNGKGRKSRTGSRKANR